MVERLWKKLCDYPADGEQKHSVPDCFERATVSDLVEALQGAEDLPLFCVAHWCALTPGETTCSLYQRVEGMDTCSVEARVLVVPLGEDA